jgi:hypothetical protein
MVSLMLYSRGKIENLVAMLDRSNDVVNRDDRQKPQRAMKVVSG